MGRRLARRPTPEKGARSVSRNRMVPRRCVSHHDRLRRLSRHIGATVMNREKIIASPYLNTEETCAYCSISRTTLWRAVKSGRIKQYGPRTVIRYRRDELDSLMNARNGKQ
jgi:excisionase family DNA binding protein